MPRIRRTIEGRHTPATFPDSSTDPFDMKYGAMGKDQLHESCKKRGLPVHGNKSVLVARLKEADLADI